MKLCKPAKQLTAALVAGAMALSLCAPALAEAPLPGAAAAVAAPTESTPGRGRVAAGGKCHEQRRRHYHQ